MCFIFCGYCVRNESKHALRNEAGEVQCDCGPRSLAWERICRAGNEYFCSQILRKLDLGVSNYVKQSAGDNGTSVKVSGQKIFKITTCNSQTPPGDDLLLWIYFKSVLFEFLTVSFYKMLERVKEPLKESTILAKYMPYNVFSRTGNWSPALETSPRCSIIAPYSTSLVNVWEGSLKQVHVICRRNFNF